MGLREQNKARTRQSLADIAREMILARGFDEVTVTEIADKVGVSRRTFFRYFPTKEAAFFANQEARLGQFRLMLSQPLTEEMTPFEHVRAVCMQMSEEYIRDREMVIAQYNVTMASKHLLAYDMKFDVEWERAIFGLLTANTEDPLAHMRARIQAGAVIGVIRAVLRHWFQYEGKPDLREMGEEAFRTLALERVGL